MTKNSSNVGRLWCFYALSFLSSSKMSNSVFLTGIELIGDRCLIYLRRGSVLGVCIPLSFTLTISKLGLGSNIELLFIECY